MRDEEFEIDEPMARFLEAFHEALEARGPEAQQATSAEADDQRLQQILHAAAEVLEMIERVRCFDHLRDVLRTVIEPSPDEERRQARLSESASDDSPAKESTSDHSEIDDDAETPAPGNQKSEARNPKQAQNPKLN